MSDQETACEYCGISYLLLHKYEKMESHLSSMSSELQDLKKYVNERPAMLSRLESLLSLQKQSALQVSTLEQELNQLKKELDWNRKDLMSFQSKNSELIKNLETEKNAALKMRESVLLQKSSLKFQLTEMQLGISRLKKELVNQETLQKL